MVKMLLEDFTHFQFIVVLLQIISIVISHSHFNLRAAFLLPIKVIVQRKRNKKYFVLVPGMLVLSMWQLVMNKRTILDIDGGVSENL